VVSDRSDAESFTGMLIFIGWMLTLVAAYRALPGTLTFWSERTMFYLHGNETAEMAF
jgi:hypothetical protein